MAWQDTMTLILRGIIGDFDVPYQYTDQRLQQMLVIAANFVNSEVTLQYTYTIDVVNVSITPDPTSIPDNSMIVLTTLKAACLLDSANMRNKASFGVKVQDDRSTIDTTGMAFGFKLIMEKGACKAYEDARMEYGLGGLDGSGVGQAILGPFAVFSQMTGPITFDSYRTFY